MARDIIDASELGNSRDAEGLIVAEIAALPGDKPLGADMAFTEKAPPEAFAEELPAEKAAAEGVLEETPVMTLPFLEAKPAMPVDELEEIPEETPEEARGGVEVSVVLPCLNEEPTIGICIEKAIQAMEKMGLRGEVVVSDNGCTDRSAEIADSLGARVVYQPVKGYGSAYLKGIGEASGKYIVIADSDNTYDLSELDRFIGPLRNGYDVVMGNRFKGNILPGAMPWHHQYIGNPVLSGILNLFFHTGIGDAHCGIRSFTKEAFERMQPQTTGMEFASEMVINACKAGLRMTEVPVTYYPRAEGTEAKLRSFRDGWRHLRFMLLYSPDWLFMIPGAALLGVGLLLLFALVFGPIEIGKLHFDVHFMTLGSLLALLGLQVISLGVYAKTYAVTTHFEEHDPLIERLARRFGLEHGILAGTFVMLAGLIINVGVLYDWLHGGFGDQNRLREAILAMTLMVVGIQTVFTSFFLSVLGIEKLQSVYPAASTSRRSNEPGEGADSHG